MQILSKPLRFLYAKYVLTYMNTISLNFNQNMFTETSRKNYLHAY